MSGTVRRIIATEVEYEPLSEEERFTEEEQLDQCCEEVSVDECADVGKVSAFVARDQEDWNFDPDQLAIPYQQQHGDKFLGVILEPVGPQGNCGEKHETWEDRLDCCDEVEEIVFDWDSSVEVLEPDSSGFVSFTGGKLPALIKIRGNGFSLDGYSLREAWTYSRTFRVYAHEMACGYAPITIDDGCTVADGGVRASVGAWSSLYYPLWSTTGIPISDCPFSMDADADYWGPDPVWGVPIWEKIEGKYKLRQLSDPQQCAYSAMGYDRHACGVGYPPCSTTPAGPRQYSIVPDFQSKLPVNEEFAVSDWILPLDNESCMYFNTLVSGWAGAMSFSVNHRRELYEWIC